MIFGLAALVATAFIGMLLLRGLWLRESAYANLLTRLSAARADIETLNEAWTQENEIVLRHEQRFGQIDQGLQPLSLDRKEGAPLAIRHQPPPQLPNRALDAILGDASSRRAATPQVETAQSAVFLDPWIDHTKKDQHGKPLWAHYYEIASIPVVLNMTFSIEAAAKRGQSCTMTVFIRLLFISFEELESLGARYGGSGNVPSWRATMTVRCDPKEVEYRAIVESKAWAMAALKRQILAVDGSDPSSQYPEAVKYRRYNEVGLRQTASTIRAIELKMTAIASTKWFRWAFFPKRLIRKLTR